MGMSPANAVVCDLSTSTVDLELTNSLRAIPNPFSQQVVLQFANPANKTYQLRLHDMTGKLIRQVNGLTGQQYTLPRADLPAGMYFANLRDEQGNFATIKMIVE